MLLSQQYICVKIDSLYASAKQHMAKERSHSMGVQLPSSVCSWLGVCYNLYKLMINYLYKLSLEKDERA